MARSIGYIVKVGVAVYIAVWLADRPGQVTIEWQGVLINTSVGILALSAFLLVVASVATYEVWRGLKRAPRQIVASRRVRRQGAGYRALTEGLVAVAAGDAEEARRLSKRADGLLNDPPLTMLLAAQTAQLAGDGKAARRYFEAMRERKETEFLGLRGLIVQTLREGDRAAALGLAERAFELRPGTPWVLETLVDLNCQLGHWREAQVALEESMRRKFVPADVGRPRLAAIMVERSRGSTARGDRPTALQQVERAHELDATLVPAIAALARLQTKAGQRKRARKLIEKTWARIPHPELARAYVDAFEADTPAARKDAVDQLRTANPSDPESWLTVAEAAIDAEQWKVARGLLEPMVETVPSARLFLLLSDLESREHGDGETARRWLDRAVHESPAPTWVCADCGTAADEWSAVCGQCGQLEGLRWRAPPRLQTAVPPGDVATPALAPPLGGPLPVSSP